MGRIEVNLHEYDKEADEAMAVLQQMPYDGQARFLRHLFQAVAYVDRTDDRDVALELCKDLASTIALHRNDTYHKATLGMSPSGEGVPIEDVLKRLA